jgi:hypothetical protein
MTHERKQMRRADSRIRAHLREGLSPETIETPIAEIARWQWHHFHRARRMARRGRPQILADLVRIYADSDVPAIRHIAQAMGA